MVDRGFFFFFFGKITATDGKRKKEYLDLRVIFSPFFPSFLSFFLSFHKSKRNSFYLEKKKTRNDPFFQRASKCLTRLSERARFSRVPWFGKHSTSFSIIDSSVFIPMSACIFVHPPVLISVFPVNHRMQIRASRGYYRFSRRGAKKDFSSIDAIDPIYYSNRRLKLYSLPEYTKIYFPFVENVKFDQANWKSAKSVV